MTRKTKLIFNPTANTRRAWPIAALLQPIVQEYGGCDWSGTVYPTHAAELAQTAAEEGYEHVIALGGDGTVHEVVNGLMQVPADRRPTLGIVPIGSGNDVAFRLGISPHPETALRQAFGGQPKPIDIGVVHNEHGQSEYWANTLGIGFDAIINIRAKQLTLLQGFPKYLTAAIQSILFNYTSFNFTAEMDGRTWQETLLMLVIANGIREGGGFLIAPQASQDDGLFDYIGVKPISRLRMLHAMTRFINGTGHTLPYSVSGRLSSLTLHSHEPLIIHCDGEIFTGLQSVTHEITVDLLPAAIQVIRPAAH